MTKPFSLSSLSYPAVMGIVNVTPDSFSDGGHNFQANIAITNALRMVDQGAAILDIGGESTRPGAQDVSLTDELDRVIPVIEGIRQHSSVPISIDTNKSQVMSAALDAGASIINDVNALRADGAVQVAADYQVPVCLMHMKGKPKDMQMNPQYEDVVEEIRLFLLERAAVCANAGVKPENIILDPGFGFGKTLEHNVRLFNMIPTLTELGYPVLVGVSRKSMLGDITGKAINERLASSVAAATLAAQMGAHIIRVHDVDETVDAVKIVNALKKYQ